MKKTAIILSIIIIILAIYSYVQRKNKNPKVFYFNGDPNARFTAITIPPFGIIINKTAASSPGNTIHTNLVHENVHWKQFQNIGLPKFYYNYLKYYIESDGKYQNNPMEQEAFIVSNQYNRINDHILPTNYSGLLA